MPATDLPLLIEAAHAAGREASVFVGPLAVSWEKPENAGPVTEADIAVNELLISKLRAARPDYGWLSEETEDSAERLSKDTIFIVDPIDGTKEYIAGRDEYTLNAALVINTVPVIGVVGAPKKNRLFYSYASGESFLIESGETRKINCQKKQPKGQIVALSSSLKPSDVVLNKLKKFILSIGTQDSLGSCNELEEEGLFFSNQYMIYSYQYILI